MSRQKNDKFKRGLHRKIITLINDIIRQPFAGLGKPEPLKHELKGYWSRRITDEHRLVYGVTETEIIILSCRFHYNDGRILRSLLRFWQCVTLRPTLRSPFLDSPNYDLFVLLSFISLRRFLTKKLPKGKMLSVVSASQEAETWKTLLNPKCP